MIRMQADAPPYEDQCRDALRRWLQVEPGLVARGFGRSTRPLVRVMKPLLPESLLEQSFALADEAGRRLAWRRRLLKTAGLPALANTSMAGLEDCDALWKKQRRRMMLLAAGEGAVTGLGGAVGWALDVPALLILALEGVHRSAWCYGVEPDSRTLPLAVMSLAAANTREEKAAAWALAIHSQLDSGQWQAGFEQVLRPAMTKQAMNLSLARLAQQLSLNLGQRKALGMVPLAGALVGGSVNAWYLKDVMQACQYVCHALRLGLVTLDESV